MTPRSAKSANLALFDGKPSFRQTLPDWPIAGDFESSAMHDVVLSGKWSWMGPHEGAFCREWADFCGTKHAVCMANGTVTLQCALQAVGVEPGDEVIVPGLTWVATAQAAMDVGANVVFVDVDPVTLCIDPVAVEAAVTDRTRAILPVHLYSHLCDMDALGEIAVRHGLKIVEDAAHQHGGAWRGRRVGSLGDVGSFSFQQSKLLTSGEGGSLVCDDDDIYETAFALKQVGWLPDLKTPARRYCHNYRLTEMQAVLLRGGLHRLTTQNTRRRDAAAYLQQGLHEIAGPLSIPAADPRVTEQAFYRLTMHYDPGAADNLPREAYQQALAAEGLAVPNGYQPVYRADLLNLYDRTSPIPYRDSEAVQNYASLHLTNVERAANETTLLLPHVYLLADDQCLDDVLTTVRKINDHLPVLRKWWAAKKPATS